MEVVKKTKIATALFAKKNFTPQRLRGSSFSCQKTYEAVADVGIFIHCLGVKFCVIYFYSSYIKFGIVKYLIETLD